VKSKKYLNKSKPITYDYTDVPANVIKYSTKNRKPPRGMCVCGKAGLLTSNGQEYVCGSCEQVKPHCRLTEDKVIFYGRAGSNYHRQTGSYVDCHHLDPTNYVLHL